MTSKKLTKIDKSVLLGLCQTPWANDREIAEAEKIKMSTVTASKNRLKRDGIYKKAYFPAYERIGIHDDVHLRYPQGDSRPDRFKVRI
jgi:hypothetical protein